MSAAATATHAGLVRCGSCEKLLRARPLPPGARCPRCSATLWRRKPQSLARSWALLIAAFVHGMAHYPGSITSPLEGIYITLMYGLPLGLLYVKRDLEQAIAYHFFVDVVRFTAFVIWNRSI